jgi:hypothetical protein
MVGRDSGFPTSSPVWHTLSMAARPSALAKRLPPVPDTILTIAAEVFGIGAERMGHRA